MVTCLALALLWGGAQLLTRWSESERPFERGLGLGLLGGIAALLIHSAGDFNLHITANAMLFVVLLGLATRVLIIDCSDRRAASLPNANALSKVSLRGA